MPPKKIQRSQFRMSNTCASIESLRTLLSRITPFLPALSWDYQKTKPIITLPPRLKFTKKPAILPMKIKTKTKTKIIQRFQKSRIIVAEMTSCQRSRRTTKRRCLSRIGCYLNSYSNNKPNGRWGEPECFPNSTAAEPLTDRGNPEISPKSLGLLTP